MDLGKWICKINLAEMVNASRLTVVRNGIGTPGTVRNPPTTSGNKPVDIGLGSYLKMEPWTRSVFSDEKS